LKNFVEYLKSLCNSTCYVFKKEEGVNKYSGEHKDTFLGFTGLTAARMPPDG
jgi:hypothetical protein